MSPGTEIGFGRGETHAGGQDVTEGTEDTERVVKRADSTSGKPRTLSWATQQHLSEADIMRQAKALSRFDIAPAGQSSLEGPSRATAKFTPAIARLSGGSTASAATGSSDEEGGDETSPSIAPGFAKTVPMTRQDSLALAHRRLSLAAPGKYGGAPEQRRAPARARLSLNPRSLSPMRRMSSTLKAVGRSLLSSFSIREHAPACRVVSQPELSSTSDLSGSQRRSSVTFARDLTRIESKD